ncbi:MAG: hypothetical protein ONB31_04810 [candidate division KSB1 bacterium]|nr:hypothetical protein [candidate division KSB1 bacterium]MDZ7336251.1 hypothetical protein [candidate division KSB1 bacterium]MDZ7357285.1 hypothetical protein [candidate division KSB1 bacterium]MDZ7401437.1 hypothetical protein [candidate division KSB1 bacterium]
MKTILIILSFIGLALTLFPSLLVFLAAISFRFHLSLMLLGTVIWFSTAPFWLKKSE